MLSSQIIEAGTLATDGKRVAVSVRMPWYRALPLSSITGVALSVDGVEVPTASITWTTQTGESYRLVELPPRFDQWWFVLDSAKLEGDCPELAVGLEYEVEVHIGLYIPYLPAGDGFITIAEQDRKIMTLESAS